MRLIDILYAVVMDRSNRLSVDEIAEQIGYTNPSSLYKAVSPNEHNYHLPAERLVSLMKITGNVAPLEWLCRQMGYEAVRITGRKASEAALGELPRLFGVFHDTLRRMYQSGDLSDEGYRTVREFMSQVMGQAKAAEAVRQGQQAFDFDCNDPRM